MDDEVFRTFVTVLQKSVKKNGADKPATLGHVANIAAYAQKLHDMAEHRRDKILAKADEEFWADYTRYGLGEGVDG